MNELNTGRWRRHQLVTAAHDFLLAVLPFRYPDSPRALVRFLDIAVSAGTSIPETDAVLIDVLAVLSPHAHCVNLLDRYIASRRHHEPVPRFRECVEEIIRRRGAGDRHIEMAMAIVDGRYRDDAVTQALVAKTAHGDHLHGVPSSHASRCRRHTSRDDGSADQGDLGVGRVQRREQLRSPVQAAFRLFAPRLQTPQHSRVFGTGKPD
jgi:hypothetical protein